MRWLLTLAIIALLACPTAFAQGSVQTPAVWVVTGHEVISGAGVEHRGDIVVLDGGTLEIRQSNLTIVPTSPQEPLILVKSGGRLVLNGTPLHPATLERRPEADPLPPYTSLRYSIRVENGAELVGNDCDISGAGLHIHTMYAYGPLLGYGGMQIAGEATLDDCVIHDTFGGFWSVPNSTVTMRRVRTWSNEAGFAFAGNFLIDGLHAQDAVGGSSWPNYAIVRNATIDGPLKFYGNSTTPAEVSNAHVRGIVTATSLNLDNVTIMGGIYAIWDGRIHARNIYVDSGDTAFWLADGLGSVDLFVENSTLLGGSFAWDAKDRIHARNVYFERGPFRRPSEPIGFVWDASIDVLVVDEAGQPLPGRKVLFTAADLELAAETNATGHALVYATRGVLREGKGFDDRTYMTWNVSTDGASAQVVLQPRGSQVTLLVPDGAAGAPPKTAGAPHLALLTLVASAALATRRRRPCERGSEADS